MVEVNTGVAKKAMKAGLEIETLDDFYPIFMQIGKGLGLSATAKKIALKLQDLVPADEEDDEEEAAPKRGKKKPVAKKAAAKKAGGRKPKEEVEEVIKVKMLDGKIADFVDLKKNIVTLKIGNRKKDFAMAEFEEKKGRGFSYVQIEAEEEDDGKPQLIKMADGKVGTLVEFKGKHAFIRLSKTGKPKKFNKAEFEESDSKKYAYEQAKGDDWGD